MIIEEARINSNCEIAQNIWQMELTAPEIVASYKGPGQFVSILGEESWSHPLRRPMSIASVEENSFSIIYKIFGSITSKLQQKKSGDTLSVLGPLGNTFTARVDGIHPVLVGGGVGLAPILNLHEVYKENNILHTLILGAKNKSEHFIEPEPDKDIYVTTDDGSAGLTGTVMVALNHIIPNTTSPALYACGPEPMLRVVQSFSLSQSIPAQLSVESYMGCGVGLCQGCVIEKENPSRQEHSYHEKYSLVCVDGPVYDAQKVKFESA